MSQPLQKPSFLVIDSDDDDNWIIESPISTTQTSKIASLTKKKTSVETGRCSQPTKASQGKTNKSLITSSFPSSKNQKGWISSSFGGFKETSSSSAAISKKKKILQSDGSSSATGNNGQYSKSSIKNEELWIDNYRPTSESELAVHKKKVEEVRSWLLENLCTKSNGILLLTGPVGAGKTATIHALSTEQGFEIQEWTNPLIPSIQEVSDFNTSQSFTPKFVSMQSQLVLFQEFLLRANKYPTLSIFGSRHQPTPKKIILIEDLPNIFFQDARKFHDVLMMYKQTGRSPIVLIISDSQHEESNVHRLLPKNVQQSLGVATVSFNPVAPTSLVKTLNRILTLESKKAGKDFFLPTKDTINELSQSSAGDIRTAINALQFCCQRGIQDVSEIPLSKSAIKSGHKRQKESKAQEKKRKKPKIKESQSRKTTGGLSYGRDENQEEHETLAAIGGKDTSIFLFRALGKILYCKRDVSESDQELLPKHLSHLARNVPQFCPEDVIERAHLSSEMLNLYLHQNYLDFFTDVEDVVRASEYLSDSNMMSVEWMHRSSLIPYMSSIATRGLMFSNTHRVGSSSSVGGASKGGWRPLHKPQWFEVNKKTRDNNRTAKDLFPEQTCPTAVLHTQILPYLAITDVTLKTPGQISFVNQMGRYHRNKSAFRSSSSTLDEKDCGSDIEDAEPTDSQTSASNTVQESKDMELDDVEILNSEDIVIEDFDDEW
ncbi:cell cycle checkpoint protein RAD17-like [Actinia tenebrosa]|uniref:Cell cycle checkpoint protein RAD17-like n=1 Tax=Actinia tenebrosa TaxID=6105 RepID=A0A6P8H4Z9_ACTTE|nr:cell cycle checkpoint protein RAD17-like [Actinia tenebrosa]